MARFSGKIQSAKFVDSTEKTIEVLYGDTASKLSSWYLQVDYNNQDFLDFVEEVDLEVVGDTTHEFYKNQKSQYEVEIEAKASQLAVKLAEDMFEKWMSNAQRDIAQEYNNIKQEYDNVDLYKEEQLKIAEQELFERQNVVDQELTERYLEADRYKREQLKILEEELNDRYAEVDLYKEEQITIAQQELDAQVQERYLEADRYKQEQFDQLKQEFSEQETKLAKTAEQIQAELDFAERQRHRLDEEAYKTEQEKKKLAEERSELLKKFKQGLNLPETSDINLSGEQFIKMLMDKNSNEDFLFKAKITLFNRDEVKKHPDREMKLKIRKATTIVDLLAAYKDVIEAAHEETSL